MSVAGQFVAGDVRAGKTKPTTNNKTKLEVRLPVKTGDRTSSFLPVFHPICVGNQRPRKNSMAFGHGLLLPKMPHLIIQPRHLPADQ